ncbi:uncharacterized protein EAF01_010560 [Botrytis porri]|uniref:uncharacterized protein n=1 Tax=Botrytis porri TaxID=87229 RepID=UPI001902A40A|nr:uncharacterized protein EAF01_010560 [Botrytis porri]KAF7890751.1 hypothetical protein EAF01_010560 [Botrytis porri]
MPSLVDSLTNLVSSIFNAIIATFSSIIAFLQSILSTILGLINAFFAAVGSGLAGIAQTFEGLVKFLLSTYTFLLSIGEIGGKKEMGRINDENVRTQAKSSLQTGNIVIVAALGATFVAYTVYQRSQGRPVTAAPGSAKKTS